MRIIFEGQMRSIGKDYFPFTSIQYNYFDDPTRLFFMKGRMFGVTIPGYHRYVRGAATKNLKDIRSCTGVAFQDPGDQQFSATVFDDVAFGSLNMGLPVQEVMSRVRRALAEVGIEGFGPKSPHHLSFGEK